MESIIGPILKFFYDIFGASFVIVLGAVIATAWAVLKIRDVADKISSSMNRMATAQEDTNKIILDQQHICRRHSESQLQLVDNMNSLIHEVHEAAVSGSRVQESNLKAVLEVLERQMELNRKT